MPNSATSNSAYSGICLVVDQKREYIPLISVRAHASILSTVSRTQLVQTFRNPCKAQLDELRYIFPVYDGVSVVSFVCTVGDRVIHGVVRERQSARQTYDKAVARGEVAGLLEQSPNSADVFTTKIGHVPAGAEIRIELTYLGELQHDVEVDGLRYTIPTSIVPRYGSSDMLETVDAANVSKKGGISVTVDVEMPGGSSIKSVQSPSHPISVQIGSCSTSSSAEPSLRMASTTLALGSAELDKDFVLQVVASNLGEPSAVLETHPNLPNQKALMVSLVPKFNLRMEKPEIVFVCDRSGSMRRGSKIENVKAALTIFLRSLPVGVKFNICCFGSKHSFLWPRSQSYNQETLEAAVQHVETFGANMGNTLIYEPMKDVFERRYRDMNIEVFLLTDGGIADLNRLFHLVKEQVAASNGRTRVFTMGVGNQVSHSLIEGVARAGNGFAQTVMDGEKMDKKVIRMLKGALTPHIADFSLHLSYGSSTKAEEGEEDDGFLLVEKSLDSLDTQESENASELQKEQKKKPISLYDASHQEIDISSMDASSVDDKYSHLPTVPVPRILQTPSIIPSLFSFIRTTIYVLISDDEASAVPKSVSLRGVAPEGPLELEIPVTTLSESGTTIHQLAARKEVKELEEGRGWLAQARDRPSGRLLKDDYEGRFSDMVEREAVRLGLLYQVAGKWCSFVAVESERQEDEENWEEECVIVQPQARSRPSMYNLTSQPRLLTCANAIKIDATIARAGTGGFCARIGVSKKKKRSTSLASPQPTGALPASAAAGGSQDATSSNQGLVTSSAETTTTQEEDATEQRAAEERVRVALENEPVYKRVQNKPRRFYREEAPRSATATKQDRNPSDEPLQRIASLQTFTGMWTWSPELELISGVNRATAEQATRDGGLDEARSEVLSTITAVLFLKKKLADEEETWEMMVQKAVDWVKETIGPSGDYDMWEQALATLY